MNKRKGFTLLELLIVLAIMGILLSVISVQIGKSSAEARQVQIDTELVELLTAAEQFSMQNPQSEAHSQMELIDAGLLKEPMESTVKGYTYQVRVEHGRVQVALSKGDQVYEQGAYRAEKKSSRLYLD